MNTAALSTAWLIVIAVLIGMPSGASGAESQALCNGQPDKSRPLHETRFGDKLSYCFDGVRLHVVNSSNAVVRLSLEGDFGSRRRDESGGSVAASGIAARSSNLVLPPSYAFSVEVGRAGGTVTRVLDTALSLELLIDELISDGIGLVPISGDGFDLANAVIGFINEIEEVARQHEDCLARNGFFGDIACGALLARNVNFAVVRAGIKGVPFVNDVPKIAKYIKGTRIVLSTKDLATRVNDQVLLAGNGVLSVPAAPGFEDPTNGSTVTGDLPDRLPGGPTPEIYLQRGSSRGAASWYSVVLNGFEPGASVTLHCHDSVDRSFHTETIVLDNFGFGSDSTLCYSADGPDHWVTGGGVESNHVNWDTAGAPSTNPPPTNPATTNRPPTNPPSTNPPSTNPPPTSPPASPKISLSRGGAGPVGYWYSVTLTGFTPSSSVTVACHDSVDRSFWTQTVTITSTGRASDSTLCYSADGPDHWVTGGGVESNHVNWDTAGAPSTNPPSTNSPPTSRPASPKISLSRGGAGPVGYWYSVTLTGFTPGSSVTVACHDSVDRSFWTQTFTITSTGRASDSTLCYSADGPDHWVTGGGVESNHVNW